jgi:hypothetical protein
MVRLATHRGAYSGWRHRSRGGVVAVAVDERLATAMVRL